MSFAMLPDDGKRLLVQTIVGEPALAQTSWTRWANDHSVDDADIESKSVLPLVYLTLREKGIDAPELPVLKTLYQHA